MKKEFYIEPTTLKDIVPNYCGIEHCKAGQTSGITTRSNYLVHFVLEGNGELVDKFGTHKISGGELFIMRPGEITTYSSDKNTPWVYAWLDFKGSASHVFNTDKSIYHFPKELGEKLWKIVESDIRTPNIFVSLIFELMHALFSSQKSNIALVDKIMQYIESNYMNYISINSISNVFNFDRSYLYRTFKDATGFGIKDYITDIRIKQAKILLKKGYTVSNTAFAVGYKNEFHFSKIFKRKEGFTPNDYKNDILR